MQHVMSTVAMFQIEAFYNVENRKASLLQKTLIGFLSIRPNMSHAVIISKEVPRKPSNGVVATTTSFLGLILYVLFHMICKK